MLKKIKKEHKRKEGMFLAPNVIILIIMGVVLMVWVIFCGICFIRHGKDVIVSQDFVAHVQCETCGTHYDVDTSEFTKTHFSKHRSVTKTKVEKGALVNRPHYNYYAKKLHCPKCGKKQYAQVLNVNEINRMTEKFMLRSGLRWLIIMAIGGAMILATASIPLHFVDQARKQNIEDLKEQRYDQFKERYGV